MRSPGGGGVTQATIYISHKYIHTYIHTYIIDPQMGSIIYVCLYVCMYPICDPSWIYAGSAHAYIQSGDTKSLHRKWLKLHYVGYIMWGYKVRLGVCDDISEGRGRGQGVGWLLGLGICNTICNWISPVIICHRWTSTTSLTQKQRKWDKQINFIIEFHL